MVAIILVVIVLIAISFVLIVCGSDDYHGVIAIFGGILLCGSSIGLGLLIAKEDYKSKPSAMDVYQGKTTLKISYVDSVAVDSTVIFKEHE